MSNKEPEDKDGLLELIKKLWLPVAGFLGAVTLAYNFYKMWLGDQKTVTYFTAGGGLLILLIALGWIGFSKKTVVHKKKAKNEPRYSITYRRIALGLLGVVVIGSGVGGWLLYKNSISQAQVLEKKIVILVTQFDGPEETYGLRDQIMEELHNVANEGNDIVIVDSKEIITSGQGSEYARGLGERENADLVIWAWYKPTDNPNITIHFENLSTAQIQTLKSSEIYKPQATLAKLNSFEVQQKIGAETKTLISFIAGVVSFQSGDYQKALNRFEPILLEKNISTYINLVTLYFNIGYSYQALGSDVRNGFEFQYLDSYKRSIVNYDHLLALDPSYYLAYNNRGFAYSILGDHERAIQDFDKTIELEPNFYMAYIGRGNVYSDLEDYDHAIQDYDKAIDLEPDYETAYYNRGIIYYYLKDYDRAVQDFSKAIELNPKYVIAYNNRGIIYVSLKDYDRAIQDFSKTIDVSPNFIMGYINRGIAYSDLKDYEHSIQDFDKAIQLEPNYETAYYNRGETYYDMKDYEHAIQDFSKAIELNPNYAGAYMDRGLVYAELQDYNRAIQSFTKAIELNPNITNAYFARGQAYQILGMTFEAQNDYAKFKELTGKDAP